MLTGWLNYVVFLAITLGGGLFIGAQTEVRGWYDTLNKPSWTPPDWLFPIAWTVLYIMIAIAGARTFQRAPTSPAMAVWVLQLLLNFAWTPVFFMAQRPAPALGIVLTMLALILAFIAMNWVVDRTAALLFVPYAIWVSYASALNAAIVARN